MDVATDLYSRRAFCEKKHSQGLSGLIRNPSRAKIPRRDKKKHL
jgi:hypothetical protein